ncbi:hypothetical protein LCGC14_1189160 [marine sediment metagenome]|uniref:Uncharacterized protein n=1 Tax=marine sediment metagenome TaxID=412755 RepID=A0A0F9LPV3_9ZZZZ
MEKDKKVSLNYIALKTGLPRLNVIMALDRVGVRFIGPYVGYNLTTYWLSDVQKVYPDIKL